MTSKDDDKKKHGLSQRTSNNASFLPYQRIHNNPSFHENHLFDNMYRNLLVFLLIATTVTSKPQRRYATRIVGGKRTSIARHPYIIAIINSNRQDESNDCFCGGSILSQSWVLTAAHCLFTSMNTYHKPYKVSIIAGSTNCFNLMNEKYQIVPIVRYYAHPLYDMNNMNRIDNDIGVVMLKFDLIFTATVQPVKLLEIGVLRGKEPYEFFRNDCVSMGWGVQNYGRSDSDAVLYSVNLPLFPTRQCQEIYEGSLFFNVGNVVCTLQEGHDSCTGDSGGPLVCAGGFQVGVVSAGIGCGTKFYPNVWTRVDTYFDWIQATTEPKTKAFQLVGGAGEKVVRQDVGIPILILYYTYKFIN